MRALWHYWRKTLARLHWIGATVAGTVTLCVGPFVRGRAAPQLIGPMILPGFMMLSGSSAFLIVRISDIASPCSS